MVLVGLWKTGATGTAAQEGNRWPASTRRQHHQKWGSSNEANIVAVAASGCGSRMHHRSVVVCAGVPKATPSRVLQEHTVEKPRHRRNDDTVGGNRSRECRKHG